MAKLAASRIVSLSRTTLLLAGVLACFSSIEGCKKAPPPEAPAPGPTTTQAPAPAAVPFIKRHIYEEGSDPAQNVAVALKQAKSEHKRVIIDFGGDWCGDCQVLDIYLRQAPNEELLDKNFVVAHVFVNSHIDDPAVIKFGEKYGVPLHKGVPALAVLDASGKTLYSQKTGEFENMRRMDAQSVTDFLNHWKS
jgi:thiol-disulfide isomerase/thioredoxin